MAKRKGQLTSAGIDRGWPYQVAIPASECTLKNQDIQHDFCKELSRAPRGHSVVFNDVFYLVHCFAEKTHAEAFMQRFGGEWFDPSERGRGNNWMKWNKKNI